MELLEFLKSQYVPSRVNFGEESERQAVIAMRTVLKQFRRPVKVSEICEDFVISHMRWLLDQDRSPETVNRRRGYLMTIWKHAYKRGHNSHEYWKADVPKAKQLKRRPLAWSLADIDVMLRQADQVVVRESHPFGPNHWRALILLLYYTGMRIRAALNLPRSALRGRILMIPAEIQKDREELVFHLPNDLVTLMLGLSRPCEERHGRVLSEMLIPWPWRLDKVQLTFSRYILTPAGLPDNDRRLKFHAIRRTVATLVAATRGEEAARDVLGHSSIEMTRRYIADPSTVDPSLPASLSPMDVLPPLGNCG